MAGVEQVPSDELRIPKWAYVLAVLVGPALGIGAVHVVFVIIGFVFDLFAQFDYWWVVGVVILYLVLGVVCAGCLYSLEGSKK